MKVFSSPLTCLDSPEYITRSVPAARLSIIFTVLLYFVQLFFLPKSSPLRKKRKKKYRVSIIHQFFLNLCSLSNVFIGFQKISVRLWSRVTRRNFQHTGEWAIAILIGSRAKYKLWLHLHCYFSLPNAIIISRMIYRSSDLSPFLNIKIKIHLESTRFCLLNIL